MGAFTRVVMYVIPIIVLVVAFMIFFGDSGMFEEIKEGVLGIVGVVSENVEVEFGIDELSGGEVTVSQSHEDYITKLVSGIEKMRDSSEACFLQVTTSIPKLDEEGTTLAFETTSSGDMNLVVSGGAAGKQIVTSLSETITGVSSCIIAGDRQEASNFFSYYISRGNSVLAEPHYRTVRGVNILFSDGGYLGNSGNKIIVPEFGDEPVNDENDNFENNGWLYTPGNGIICFFPTNYVTDADEDGIANEWFDSSQKNSVPYRILTESGSTSAKVKECS